MTVSIIQNTKGHIIELLQEHMDKAQEGKLESIAIISTSGNNACTSYAYNNNSLVLLGGLDILKHEIIVEIHNEE